MFEVACRHGSYSAAARELHVTHSAVSQRIRQLEEELGLTLFERQGNRMVPTSSGLRLQAGVKNAFSEMSAALAGIHTRRTDAEITVSLLPVMAARWLVPRLSRFTARFPHINLHIKTGQSLANFKSDGVDIAIRFGTGDSEGTPGPQASRRRVLPGLQSRPQRRPSAPRIPLRCCHTRC